MRGASISDLHLGFKAFDAAGPDGNCRMLDVEKAWRFAVSDICNHHQERPLSVVTVAGDIFHRPTVGVRAIWAWFWGLRRFEEAGIPVVAVQGNHDDGRSADVWSPLELTEFAKRAVASNLPEPIGVVGGRPRVYALPFTVGTKRVIDLPSPYYDVCVVHAPLAGAGMPSFYAGDEAIPVAELARRFKVVAAGDWHDYHPFHEQQDLGGSLAFYSGSLERVSSNPWRETAPKGWVEWDMYAGTTALHEIKIRPMVYHRIEAPKMQMSLADALRLFQRNLPPVDNMPMTNRPMARLHVMNASREMRAQVPWDLVKELKEECLHFQLDIEYAERETVRLADRRETGPQSLMAEAEEHFQESEEPVRERALTELQTQIDEVAA